MTSPIARCMLRSALAIILVASFATCTSASLAKADRGSRAPSFVLPGRGGDVVALDSLHAKIVLVDFWASWCVPCRQSFAWMNSMHERYGSKGLAIVAIDLDKERKAADAFLATHPASFRIAFDPQGKTAEAFGVAAMPSSFLVAPDGSILLRHQGFDPKKTAYLEAKIAERCAP